MDLRDWWNRRQRKRLFEEWLYFEQNRLDLLEIKILLKIAETDLERQKIELKCLRRVDQRLKRKPEYIY